MNELMKMYQLPSPFGGEHLYTNGQKLYPFFYHEDGQLLNVYDDDTLITTKAGDKYKEYLIDTLDKIRKGLIIFN